MTQISVICATQIVKNTSGTQIVESVTKTVDHASVQMSISVFRVMIRTMIFTSQE